MAKHASTASHASHGSFCLVHLNILQAGDRMHIVGEAPDAGWLKASLNGNVGLVPRTHVEIAASHADGNMSNAAARPGPSSSPSGTAGIRTAKAKYTYVRQNPDELSFEVIFCLYSAFFKTSDLHDL
jgi:hypothetical protein